MGMVLGAIIGNEGDARLLCDKHEEIENMKTIFSVLIVLLLSVGVTPVFADGTHGVKVTVINKSGGKIEIMTYNSKDSSMTVPHKVYYADNAGTRIAKAHGQGTGKLRLTVRRPGKGTKCQSATNKILKATGDKWNDGDTITVANCNVPDYDGGHD